MYFGVSKNTLKCIFPLILNKPKILKQSDIRLRGRYRKNIFSHILEAHFGLTHLPDSTFNLCEYMRNLLNACNY